MLRKTIRNTARYTNMVQQTKKSEYLTIVLGVYYSIKVREMGMLCITACTVTAEWALCTYTYTSNENIWKKKKSLVLLSFNRKTAVILFQPVRLVTKNHDVGVFAWATFTYSANFPIKKPCLIDARVYTYTKTNNEEHLRAHYFNVHTCYNAYCYHDVSTSTLIYYQYTCKRHYLNDSLDSLRVLVHSWILCTRITCNVRKPHVGVYDDNIVVYG